MSLNIVMKNPLSAAWKSSSPRKIGQFEWVSMYIAHDDNAGSNYCIPQNYIEGRRRCTDDSGNTIDCKQQRGGVAYAIGTLPAEVEVNPIDAETLGTACLLKLLEHVPQEFPDWTQKWQKRLEGYHNEGLLVLRTILVTGEKYAHHLATAKGWKGAAFPDWVIAAMDSLKEDLFWMVELSVPELFAANRRKVGELLLRATQTPDENDPFSNFLCARFPGCFVILHDSSAQEQSESTAQPQFFYVALNVEDHVELFGCEEGAIRDK